MDVRIDCVCPRTADGAAPHEQDTITLSDVLDFRRTLSVRQEVRFAEASAREQGVPLSLAELTAVMAEAYLRHGIAAWSLVDEKGKPLPPSRAAIAAFVTDHYEAAEKVGDAADDLYSEKVIFPLLTGASNSSPATPTRRSTSPKTGGSMPRKGSKRSSTTTTPMAVTGPMVASPGGGSSSSQSLDTAA